MDRHIPHEADHHAAETHHATPHPPPTTYAIQTNSEASTTTNNSNSNHNHEPVTMELLASTNYACAIEIVEAQRRCAATENVLREMNHRIAAAAQDTDRQREDCERLTRLSTRLREALAEVAPVRLGVLSAQLSDYSTTSSLLGKPTFADVKRSAAGGTRGSSPPDDDDSEGGGSTGEGSTGDGSTGGGSTGGGSSNNGGSSNGGSSGGGSHGTSTTVDLKDSRLLGATAGGGAAASSSNADSGSGSFRDGLKMDGSRGGSGSADGSSTHKTSPHESSSNGDQNSSNGEGSSGDTEAERDCSLADFAEPAKRTGASTLGAADAGGSKRPRFEQGVVVDSHHRHGGRLNGGGLMGGGGRRSAAELRQGPLSIDNLSQGVLWSGAAGGSAGSALQGVLSHGSRLSPHGMLGADTLALTHEAASELLRQGLLRGASAPHLPGSIDETALALSQSAGFRDLASSQGVGNSHPLEALERHQAGAWTAYVEDSLQGVISIAPSAPSRVPTVDSTAAVAEPTASDAD